MNKNYILIFFLLALGEVFGEEVQTKLFGQYSINSSNEIVLNINPEVNVDLVLYDPNSYLLAIWVEGRKNISSAKIRAGGENATDEFSAGHKLIRIKGSMAGYIWKTSVISEKFKEHLLKKPNLVMEVKSYSPKKTVFRIIFRATKVEKDE